MRKESLRKAESSVVHKIKETDKRIHFKVVYVDKKQSKHEHQVIFIKNKPYMESFNCDCSWCSFYGIDKKTKKLTKLCYNCLAVAKHLNLTDIKEL